MKKNLNQPHGDTYHPVNKYKVFTLRNFRDIPQIDCLSEDEKFAIEVVGNVLPFKVNNYVIDELINWDDVPNDPMYILTFPVKELLKEEHYKIMGNLLKSGASRQKIQITANEIRMQLNPNPGGQMEHNVPVSQSEKLEGMQHKYRETILFFPSQGQTCHAYCSFCFRWSQFVGMNDYKFATREIEKLISYLKEKPQITDILFTGGDPMVMKAKILKRYIEPLLEADLPNLKNIRIGSKSLSYWPYKYVTDRDSQETLNLFKKVTDAGFHLAFMAHFNHTVELETPIIQKAIKNIQKTGAVIRSQSPLLYRINDHADTWAKMWKKQVEMGIVPYYMFVVRDTGAKHFYGIPLERAWHIFRDAYQQTSGLTRTVRGPSMSAGPGKVQILGIEEIRGEKVFVLRMIQGRNPDWVHKPFFAKYNLDATWLNELEPAFGRSQFFFEEAFDEILSED